MNMVSISRKRLAVVVVLLVGIIGLSGWAAVAKTQAATNKVEKHTTIEGSLYSAGKQIIITGTINGDVHCAGQDVMIAGTVNGDVLCVAQSLTIKGKVTGSVRAAAQELIIDGQIGHGATLAAETLRINKRASIKQDMTAFASNSQIAGTIGRDSVISGGSSTVTGTVGRNITYNGSGLTLSDGAQIKGAIRYESSKSIHIADNAAVTGTVTREKKQKASGFSVALLLIILGACYVFALLLVLIWPQALHATSDIAVRSLGKTMLTGIVAAFAAPFAIALISATLIGIPLAIFLSLVGIIIMMLSGPVAAYYLGSMILARSKNAIAIMAVGASVLLAVYCIPVVGMIAAVIAYFIGSGALLIALKRKTEKPDYRVA
jgi:cytoskeletal protein CcmA (bactofilin family)